MMALSNASCLLDTNILVYASHEKSPFHEATVAFLRKIQSTSARLYISSQNLFELSSVLLYALKIPRPKVVTAVNNFTIDEKINIVYPDNTTLSKYCGFLNKYTSVHTSDIFLTSTALSHEIKIIITNDRDFTKIREIKVYNPFH